MTLELLKIPWLDNWRQMNFLAVNFLCSFLIEVTDLVEEYYFLYVKKIPTLQTLSFYKMYSASNDNSYTKSLKRTNFT